MDVLVDDVGSFPLPSGISRELFDRAYTQARQAILHGRDMKQDRFVFDNFHQVVVNSFKMKCASGLDVVNYPQHYDMNKHVTDAVYETMDRGSYAVDWKDAITPEVLVIRDEAKEISEELDRKILLRASIVGPMEAYLKVVGTVPQEDVLLMFAETVRRFAQNAILNTRYVSTEVVSLDEPSFGFQEIAASRDMIKAVLERACDFSGVTKQIHLHSSSRTADLLDVKNLDVLSFEFAASPKNIDSLSRSMLDRADKHVRVGIARTDIDAITAELHDKGIARPVPEQLVESEDVIRRRFMVAEKKYGNRMTFTGPDCGLGGWPTQESAQLLLKRTVDAVRKAEPVRG